MHVMESLFAGPDPDGSRRVSVAAVARAVQGRAAVAGRKVHIGTELVQQQFHDRRVATERREVERRLVRRACAHEVMKV